MNFGKWQRWLHNLSRNTQGRATGRKRARSARPGLEVFESRDVPAAGFFQGFEIDTAGWNAAVGVASGTHEVTSRTGSFHGEIAQGGGAYTWFGPSAATGYTATFPQGGFTTSVDVYLDPTALAAATTANDTRFDYTVAINNAAGSHRRDFAFNAGYYNDAGEGPRFVISASNNTGRGNSFPKNPGRDPFAITTSGWYTFQHRFFDSGNGVLAVELSIKDASGANQHTWTLSNATDIIGSTVGGNRYGFFATQELPFLAIENSFQSNPSAVYVDDDWASLAVGTDPDGNGPANLIGFDAFSSIQDAINAAAGGGTVNVAAGTYNEKITVNKSVSLVGAQAGVDARDGRLGAAESVLDGLGGATPLYVTASNVIVDGFTIQGNTSGNQFGFGILLGAGTSGSQVLNNIIQDNVVGLGLANNSAVNQTVIQNNLFSNNNNNGPASGNAIYSDEYVAGGALTNVLIDANRFEGHDDAALNLSASVPGSQSAITFSNNDVIDNGRAAFLFNVVNSTFSNNTVSDSTFVGSADFRIFGGVQNVSFTGNFLSDGAGDAIRVTGLNNSDLLVQGNNITGYTGDGLEVVSGAYTGGPLDATGNWWGTSTAAGVAAEIKGNVDFTPFLITGEDTSADSGFQGDFSVAPGEGSVRVKVVGGRLMITGDKLDNLITVEMGPKANSYRVTGLAGTQINGRSGSFVFENVTRGIDANLMGGDDMLVLDGSANPFTVPGTIKVRAGRGDDLVRLEGVTGKADLGSSWGSDLFQLVDSNFSELAVDWRYNGASTSLELDGVNVTGRTVVRGGNGADTVRAVDSNLGSVLIQTGFGSDTVRLDGVHATGQVRVETGGGKDLVAVSGSKFDAAVVLSGGLGHDELDAGTLGTPNTKVNAFDGGLVTRGFETKLS